MEKEVIKRIFNFLEAKEELKQPLVWKLKTNMPLTKEDLKINGDLQLSNITSLPDGLEVKGTLYLDNSSITSLPKGLKVGDDLSLYKTKITLLPKGLEVGRSLFIRNTPLEDYTNEELRDMINPRFIKGDIIR
jgi:hypothetical protein